MYFKSPTRNKLPSNLKLSADFASLLCLTVIFPYGFVFINADISYSIGSLTFHIANQTEQ